MNQQLEMAKGRLFNVDSLAVKNIKLFPGTNRDATVEQFAEEINRSLSQISTGDFTAIDSDD